jgi:hypothetical protein
MTVRELIVKLETLPQDLLVKIIKTEGDENDEYSWETVVEDAKVNNDDTHTEKHPYVELESY